MKKRNNILFSLIQNVIRESLDTVKKEYENLNAKGKNSWFIPKHDEFPRLSFTNSNPFPFIQLLPRIIGERTNYVEILNKYLKNNEIESWNKIADYFKSDEFLINYYSTPFGEPNIDYSYERFAKELKNLIDHIANRGYRSQKKIDLKIDLWINSIYDEILSYDIQIPILNNIPDCISFKLSNEIRIEKLTENDHLNRNTRTGGIIVIKQK